MEKNKGRRESRSIRTNEVSPEDVGFPMACQVARLLRQTQGRKDEEVALITSASPHRLNASQWLRSNRQGWGIESGLHQRLDVSYNDDRCRIKSDQGMLVMGIYRRIANSLFMEWNRAQRRPDQVTTTTFQTMLGANHGAKALRLLQAKRPKLNSLS